jgi:hypothetical protein
MSEYQALSHAMKVLLPMRCLLLEVATALELPFEVQATIHAEVFKDNNAALLLATNQRREGESEMLPGLSNQPTFRTEDLKRQETEARIEIFDSPTELAKGLFDLFPRTSFPFHCNLVHHPRYRRGLPQTPLLQRRRLAA